MGLGLIIFVFIFIIINIIKRTAIFQKINAKWVLSFYGVLLLIAVVFYYLLPIESSVHKIVDNKQELARAQKSSEQLTMAASEGKQIAKENIAGVIIKQQWDFPYEGEKLEIIGDNEESSYVFKLIERKDVNDKKVEVTQYATRSIKQHIDLTDQIKPYRIQLEKNILKLAGPSPIDIQIGQFNNEFTITQITEGWSMDDPFYHDDDVWSETVLYIRVPKDVEIKGEVEFVTQ